MKTLDRIYRFFILLVALFFVAVLYQYDLIVPFVNQVAVIFNLIIAHIERMF